MLKGLVRQQLRQVSDDLDRVGQPRLDETVERAVIEPVSGRRVDPGNLQRTVGAAEADLSPVVDRIGGTIRETVSRGWGDWVTRRRTGPGQ